MALERIGRADCEGKIPCAAVMPDLSSLASRGLSAMVYEDGTVLVDEAELEAKPDLFSELQSALMVAGIKSIDVYHAQIGWITDERARVLSAQHGDTEIDKAAALKLFEQVVGYAVENGCSDIHIYVRSAATEIRYRKNGEIIPHMRTPTYTEVRAMLSRAWNWEGSGNAKQGFDVSSQDHTSFSLTVPVRRNGKDVRETVRLRLEKSPIDGDGQAKATIRVMPVKQALSLSQLGVAPDVCSLMSSTMRQANGLVLITGPTGQGKSTLLHGCLHLMPPNMTCQTMEDPVELQATYNRLIAQTTVNANLTYVEQLRSMLRHDPNAIVIGEMRDPETAQIAVTAAMTGHLVLSTLHTNSTLEAVTRMMDMGVKPYDLAQKGVLKAVMAVRLVPVLCQHCAVPASFSASASHPDVQEALTHSRALPSAIRVRGAGCQHCSQGVTGRSPIVEYISVDDLGRQCLRLGDIEAWRRHLESTGWQSLQELAWERINAGLLDPRDANGVVGGVTRDESGVFNYAAARQTK